MEKAEKYCLTLEAKKELLNKIPFDQLRKFCEKRDIFIFTKDENFLRNKMLTFSFSLEDIKELFKMRDEIFGN